MFSKFSFPHRIPISPKQILTNYHITRSTIVQTTLSLMICHFQSSHLIFFFCFLVLPFLWQGISFAFSKKTSLFTPEKSEIFNLSFSFGLGVNYDSFISGSSVLSKYKTIFIYISTKMSLYHSVTVNPDSEPVIVEVSNISWKNAHYQRERRKKTIGFLFSLLVISGCVAFVWTHKDQWRTRGKDFYYRNHLCTERFLHPRSTEPEENCVRN